MKSFEELRRIAEERKASEAMAPERGPMEYKPSKVSGGGILGAIQNLLAKGKSTPAFPESDTEIPEGMPVMGKKEPVVSEATTAALLSGNQGQGPTIEAAGVDMTPDESVTEGEDVQPATEKAPPSSYELIQRQLRKPEEPDSPDFSPLQKELDAAIDKRIDRLDNIAAAYQQEKDSLKSKQLWETMINAMGMIAAGIYGRNTGTDMSGVKFDKQDWEAKLANVDREMQAAERIAKQKYDLREGSIKNRMALLEKAGREADKRYGRAEREYYTARGEAFTEYMQGIREKQAGTKAAQKLTDDKIKSYGKVYKAASNNIQAIMNNDKLDVENKAAQVAEAIYKNAIAEGIAINRPKAIKAAKRLFQADPNAWVFTGDRSPEEQTDLINTYILGLLQEGQ